MRVLALTSHFSIPAMVCVNKWDLCPELAERIEDKARGLGAEVAGRIRYDRGVSLAQVQGQAVVETGSASAADVRRVWERLDA